MSQQLYYGTTPQGGVIRLHQWPEGYELWHHGQCVWRSWKIEPPVHANLRKPLVGLTAATPVAPHGD